MGPVTQTQEDCYLLKAHQIIFTSFPQFNTVFQPHQPHSQTSSGPDNTAFPPLQGLLLSSTQLELYDILLTFL